MASRTLFQRAYQYVKGHATESLALGAAGGCTITAMIYGRARQRALDHARRNVSTKSGAAVTATEAEAAAVARNAGAATAKVAQKGSMRTYSTTEKFALALWHG